MKLTEAKKMTIRAAFVYAIADREALLDAYGVNREDFNLESLDPGTRRTIRDAQKLVRKFKALQKELRQEA